MAKNGESLQIFFASRLVLEKGVDILINAIEASQKDPILRAVHWHICSDGYFTGEIRSLSEKYPQNVSYYGKLGIEKMRELYRMSDFLLMPSRFLETFGLTALESLASGTPVIGIRKGGLIHFIPEDLALDEEEPVHSLLRILRKYHSVNPPEALDVTQYDKKNWMLQLDQIFAGKKKILLIHDYDDLIGGAEYYLEMVKCTLIDLGKEVEFYSYHGKTSIWKRRLMFICSPFAFWRGYSLKQKLQQFSPDALWMHSILRYVGVWGVRSVTQYRAEKDIPVFLSHHDVGLLAAFPQYITDESQIPTESTRGSFTLISQGWIRRCSSSLKWLIVRILKESLPKNTKHIIFSAFLERHIRNHFSDADIMILPHPVDRSIFYP